MKVICFVVISLFSLDHLPAATVQFSYTGVANETDALGNPRTLFGEKEIGTFTIADNLSNGNLPDVSSFFFTTFLLDTDSLGNPFATEIDFDLADLTSVDFEVAGGVFTSLSIVAETEFFKPPNQFSSKWSEGQTFRFTVTPDLTGRLDAISPDFQSMVTAGSVESVPETKFSAFVALAFVLFHLRRERRTL